MLALRNVYLWNHSCHKFVVLWIYQQKQCSYVGMCVLVATPLLEECEDDTHTPEMGTWESSETPETSEFDCKGQNTSL